MIKQVECSNPSPKHEPFLEIFTSLVVSGLIGFFVLHKQSNMMTKVLGEKSKGVGNRRSLFPLYLPPSLSLSF